MSVESPKELTREDVMLSLENLMVDLLLEMQGRPQAEVTAVLRAVKADYHRFAATKPSSKDAPKSKDPTT